MLINITNRLALFFCVPDNVLKATDANSSTMSIVLGSRTAQTKDRSNMDM